MRLEGLEELLRPNGLGRGVLAGSSGSHTASMMMTWLDRGTKSSTTVQRVAPTGVGHWDFVWDLAHIRGA